MLHARLELGPLISQDQNVRFYRGTIKGGNVILKVCNLFMLFDTLSGGRPMPSLHF